MRRIPLVVLALFVAGCAGGQPRLTPGTHLTITPLDALPPPSDTVHGGQSYRLGSFDRLAISVFGLPELTRTVQVDAAGRIAVPLVGEVQAGGRTPEEVSQEITGRLRGQYVRDPQVAVNVEETVSHTLTVEGEVREPGMYPVMNGMTLLRAVASARGASELARLDDVVIFRTVGDRRMAALYNIRAIRRGQYPDPYVYAGDVIVVGDSPGRRMFRDILTVAPLLTSPLIALIQR